MKKKLFGVGLIAAFAVTLFAGCAGGENDESSDFEFHSGYYASKVNGYTSSGTAYLLDKEDDSLYFVYTVEEEILPFNIYTMEIRKDSENGKSLKTLKFFGEDIECVNNPKKGSVLAKIKNTTKSDISDYGKNDLYYVLTKAEKPVIKFTVEDSVKALIPEGYEAVIQPTSSTPGSMIKKNGEEYEISVNHSEDNDYSYDGIILMIVDKAVLGDDCIDIDKALLNGDKTFLNYWTATLSINKITRQFVDEKYKLDIIKVQEFLTKENLGEDNIIHVSLNSFTKD